MKRKCFVQIPNNSKYTIKNHSSYFNIQNKTNKKTAFTFKKNKSLKKKHSFVVLTYKLNAKYQNKNQMRMENKNNLKKNNENNKCLIVYFLFLLS